jgi:hypothetical protein
MLYTFEDLETGDLRSAVAVNEAAARLQHLDRCRAHHCVRALRDRWVAGDLPRSASSRGGSASRDERR